MELDVLKGVKALLLDLDGTLYLGDSLFDWTPGFLQTLRDLDLRAVFMTNNSSLSTTDYAAKLRRLGIDAAPDDILTSTQSALLYFGQRPDLRRVYVLGTESLAGELRDAGLEVVPSGADAVLVGFPTTMDYAQLRGAAFELQRGAAFLATHPDPACPSPSGLLPDAGSFCRCLSEATGREVDEVFGKPSEWMLHLALERVGLERSELALVGDRLMTDVGMGARHGVPTVLVLSGATARDDLAASDIRPDMVVPHVGVLGDALRRLHRR